MAKVNQLSLSDRDKTPAAHGWGYHFHHTEPQRRVPCVLGDMLAPLSADDIPPITPEAMASVQSALALLANLVGDRDHGRFLGCNNAQLEEHQAKARNILSTARALTGILRMAASQEYAPPGICPCRLCPAPAVHDGYCRRHQADGTTTTVEPMSTSATTSGGTPTAVEDFKLALETLTITPETLTE